MTTVLWNELLICPVNFSFNTYFWKLFAAWNIVSHSFSQFWTVFPSFGREKQVYPSLSHFGREKQVLDGKNPTLMGIDNQFNSIQHELIWHWIERFCIGMELELKAWTDPNWSIQAIHFQFNSVYDFKYFQGLPFGLFEFEDL